MHAESSLSFLGCSIETLKFVGAKSVETEEKLNVHPHLVKTHCNSRIKKIEIGSNIDWATAEALAIGSLMLQGNCISIITRLELYYASIDRV